LTVAKSLVDDLIGCQVTGGCLENDCQVTPAGTQVLPLLDDDNDDEPAPRSDDRPPREKVKTTTSPSPAVPWNDSNNGSKEQSLKDRVLNPVPFWQPKGKREYDELSDRLLEAANGAVFPLSSIAQGMVVEPIRWVEDGCDLDLHIIPAIRTVAARLKANSDQMRSWKICEREVYKNRDASLGAGPAVVGASSPASQGAGRYAVVNGAKRFRDEARLPRVQFHGLAGEDGNRILDAVPGATTEIVMRAIEDAGRRAAKDVSFGDVIGFCIEWCEKRVGGQNDE